MRDRSSLFNNPMLPQTRAARLRKPQRNIVIPRKPAARGPSPIVNMQELAPGAVLITSRMPRAR